MKIEITLDDPKYCEDCPCECLDRDDLVYCSLGYYDWTNSKIKHASSNAEFDKTIRPQECINKQGE